MKYQNCCICSMRRRLCSVRTKCIRRATSAVGGQCVWCEQKVCSIRNVTASVQGEKVCSTRRVESAARGEGSEV